MMLSVLIVAPLSAGYGNCEARKRIRSRGGWTRCLPREVRDGVLARPLLADDKFHRFQEDLDVERDRVMPYIPQIVLDLLVVRQV